MLKKLLAEFKQFIAQGNVIDLAVGVIIGTAFKDIVTSLTDNLISPLLGIIGGANFDMYSLSIFGAEFRYGAFITSVINFLIMAAVIFALVKVVNIVMSLGKKKEEKVEEETTKTCPFCCSEIDIKATKCPHCTSDVE